MNNADIKEDGVISKNESPSLSQSKLPHSVSRLRASSQPVPPQVFHSSTLWMQGEPSKCSNSLFQHDTSHKIISSPHLDASGPGSMGAANRSERVTILELLAPANLIPPTPVLYIHLPTTPVSPLPPIPPTDSFRKPYHMMSLLLHAMTSKSGGYITPRLHIPFEVWSQGGAKLSCLPEKVRVVEILCDALLQLQNASVNFCGPMGAVRGMGLGVGSVGKKDGELWAAKLEDFSTVCDDIAGTFGRKLGVGEGFMVKKTSGVCSF